MRYFRIIALLLCLCLCNTATQAQCPFSFSINVGGTTPVSKFGCADGTVTVHLNTSENIQVILAYTTTPGSAYYHSYINYDQPTSIITGLSAGTYQLIVWPAPFSNEMLELCGQYYSFTIGGPACSVPSITSLTPATPGCNNGTIIISGNSNTCNGYEASIDAGTSWRQSPIGEPLEFTGLDGGTYPVIIQSIPAGCVINREVVVELTPCTYTINNISADVNGLTVNASINDCNGYNLKVKKSPSGILVYSYTNISSDYNITIPLPSGNYTVEIAGSAPNSSSQYTSGVLAVNPDTDGDGIPDSQDNCPNVYNPTQEQFTYYVDADGDGYGSTPVQFCTQGVPAGYSINFNDCDDNNASVHPGAIEICGNGIDDNCNGRIDETGIYCFNGGIPNSNCGCNCPPGTSGPNCQTQQVPNYCEADISTSITTTNSSAYGCHNGSVTITANTAHPSLPELGYGYYASIFLQGNNVWNGWNIWGQPVSFSGLLPGNYGIEVTSSNPQQICTKHYLITIEEPTLQIDVNTQVANASSYGCSDGKVTVSATTNACNGYYFILALNNGGNLNYNNYSGLSGSSHEVTGLKAGYYTLFISAQSSYFPSEWVPYPIYITEPACSVSAATTLIPATNQGCSNGKLQLTVNSNDCNGYHVLIYDENNTQYNNQLYIYTDAYDEFVLPQGNYYIIVKGVTTGSCEWSSGMISIGCTAPLDSDGDGIPDSEDNCPFVYNPDQSQYTFYVDDDGDGYGSNTTGIFCSPSLPSGYSFNNGDCDDTNSSVHPGAVEVCGNLIDDDCNGIVDDGAPVCENGGTVTPQCGCNCPPGYSGVNCETSISAVTLNIKLFIQGYYQNTGTANPMDNFGAGGCLYITGGSANPLAADNITLSLMSAIDGSLIESQTGILHTDGTTTLNFSAAALNNNCYLRVTHRNSLETWSMNPVNITELTSYDFSTAANKAYGNNQVEVETGVWAMYSGDIIDAETNTPGVNDGVIESADYSQMENDVYSVVFGYIASDVTGDGVVESSDYSIMENNVYLTISVARPF